MNKKHITRIPNVYKVWFWLTSSKSVHHKCQLLKFVICYTQPGQKIPKTPSFSPRRHRTHCQSVNYRYWMFIIYPPSILIPGFNNDNALQFDT